MLVKRKLLALSIGALLTACGGGGSTPTPYSTNKWATNNGTYVGCSGHEKTTTILSAVGTNQATMSARFDVYAGSLCTGAVVGTLIYPSTPTLTYQSTVTASVSGIGATAQNLSVDKAQFNTQSMVGTLSGTGVNGLCVNYTGGNICYDSLSIPATTMDVAIYLTATTLATLTSTATGYSVEQPLLTKQ